MGQRLSNMISGSFGTISQFFIPILHLGFTSKGFHECCVQFPGHVSSLTDYDSKFKTHVVIILVEIKYFFLLLDPLSVEFLPLLRGRRDQIRGRYQSASEGFLFSR